MGSLQMTVMLLHICNEITTAPAMVYMCRVLEKLPQL